MMKKLKKISRSESTDQWRNNSGSFVRKPSKGWIHPDRELMENSCVTYQTQYVGLVKILESVKNIPFDQRGTLVREAIIRCSLASKLFDGKKRKKPCALDPVINNRLGTICLDHSGSTTSTRFSRSFIKTYVLSSGEIILDHNIQAISFASIGENDYKTLIGYISKDATFERACFVFDCKGDIADDIILTIGQAFELKYKEVLNSSTSIQTVPKKFTDPVTERYDSGNLTSATTFYDAVENGCGSMYSEVHPDLDLNADIGFSSRQRSDSAPVPINSPSESSSLYDGALAALSDISSAAIEDIPRAVENNTTGMHKTMGDDPLYLSSVDTEDGPYSASSTHTYDTRNNDLTMQSWYHGKISRTIAEKCLRCDGDFLVRESSTSNRQYVLSGMKDGIHRHILLINPEGKVTTKDRTFNDIPELIKYHLYTNTPISGTTDVYLKREVQNSAI